MRMTKKVALVAAAAVLLAAAAGFLVWRLSAPPVQNFPLDRADGAVSWSFKGTYAGNATLEERANADIQKLTALLGKGEYDDYDLYVGIGNDRAHLGDGAGAYAAYNRAVSIHPAKGLAYANLGNLFDQLGAYHTAADAYEKATTVEPAVLEYHLERLRFLAERFPQDTNRMLAALSAASHQFGDTAPVLVIEARWLAGEGRYAQAIKALQAAKMLSPKDRQAAIDSEIAQFKAKQ